MLRSLAFASIVLGLSACKESTANRAPDAAGLITSRTATSMRVIPATGFWCDSAADVVLTGPPPIIDSQGKRVDTSSLTVGKHVSVWAKYAIEETCPAGMAAERIVIR